MTHIREWNERLCEIDRSAWRATHWDQTSPLRARAPVARRHS